MEPDRRTVRSAQTRAEASDRLRKALLAKPTASSLARQAISTEQLNRVISNLPEEKRRAMQPIPTTPKGRNRPTRPTMAYRPQTPPALFSPLPAPEYLLYPTPEWFAFKGKPDVSVIVPLWKSDKVIQDQINSWELNDGLAVEIIYVDDACPNNSKQVVLDGWKRRRPSRGVGKIVVLKSNSGYGPANNIGAQEAAGDFLVFLNSDTTVTANWLVPMYELLRDRSVGAVGNLQIKEGGQWHGRVDSAGSEWTWKGMCFEHVARNIYHGQYLASPYKPEECPSDVLTVAEREMVTGCCIMMPRTLFFEIGGFDYHYRIGYWEDADLCLRVREAGYRVMFQPGSVIHHKLSSSGSAGHPFMDNNIAYFQNKWVNTGRLDGLVWTPRPGGKPVITDVLIRRLGAKGDVFLAAAILPALRKKWPNAQITFATACGDVLAGNPHLDRVVYVNGVDTRRYQVVIPLDLCYEYHPNWPILRSFADAAGVSEADCATWVKVGNVPASLPARYAVVHARSDVGSSWVGKNWRQDYWQDIVRRLHGAGLASVAVGSGGDWSVGATVDLRGKTSVPELAAVIKGASLFVGADSFPMHIAQHFAIPGVAFFGSVSPERILLADSSIVPAQARSLECLGCHHRKPVPCVGTHTCERGDLACEEQVTPECFWTFIEEVLADRDHLPTAPARVTNTPLPLA